MSDKKKSSPRKQVRFCRITQWIDGEDPAFADAIRTLCMEGPLTPRKFGVTLLYPEKKVREKIVDLAYSDEASEAIRLLNAHILYGAMLSAADFGKSVGSHLRVRIEVEGGSGDKVTLANGAVLTKAKSFKPLVRGNDGEKSAVWEVKGEIPTEGETYEFSSRKRGGDEVVQMMTSDQRSKVAQFANKVEEEYAQNLAKGGSMTDNVYLRAVVSFANWLLVNDQQTLAKIYPLFDLNPIVTFYIIFEPYKRQGPYLLSASQLGEWGYANIYEDAPSEWAAMFSEEGRQVIIQTVYGGNAPWSVREPSKVFDAVDRVRQQLSAENPTNMAKSVREFYAKAVSENKVGGLEPIFPASTQQALTGEKKLWQDEFRFAVHLLFSNDLNEAYQHVRTYFTGDDYAGELQFAATFREVRPQDSVDILTQFINSTSFFYVPCSPMTGGSPVVEDGFLEFYNPEAQKMAYLRSLKMPRSNLLGTDTATRVKLYEMRYGKRPDF